MQEITREQEARIAKLALEGGRVYVRPAGQGVVSVEVDGRVLHIDEDGVEKSAPVHEAFITLPIGLIRELVGDDVLGPALESASTKSYPEHGLNLVLGDDIRARITELLATSRRAAGVEG